MNRTAALASCIAALAACGLLSACRATSGADLAAATPEQFATTTDAWHARRLENLTAPDGWLSLVALEWLEPGPNRVGNAPDAQVHYAGFPAAHVATFVLEGGTVRCEPAPGVALEGLPADGLLRDDAQGAPTILALGDLRFHVLARGERRGVRVKDADAPTRSEFAGIERYPADRAWRIEARFVPAEAGETFDFETVIGVAARSPITGRARFEHAGTVVDAVLIDNGNGASLLRFGDATNGAGTYPAGRYLVVEPPSAAGTVVLDFNRAYNPPCAFTPFATCTLPPASNTLSFAVTAGERWGSAK
jgi:uncharacterized protein (DUF1684 family)